MNTYRFFWAAATNAPVLRSGRGRGLPLLLLVLLSGWLTHHGRAQQSSDNSPPQFYGQGDPTGEEQYLLEKLNRARLDPAGEGQRLAAWLRDTPVGAEVIRAYHTDPAQVASDFARLPAVPPLAFHADLLLAARGHSADLAPHGGLGPGAATNPAQNHVGYDGSTPDQRVAASGFQDASGGDGYAGENYSPGDPDLDSCHAGFLIDWGVPSLGHRANAMQGLYGNTNVVGIGLATIPAGLEAVNRLVTTQDYGTPGYALVNHQLGVADVPAYLLGVVYADTNANGEYDPGEGVAGVTVTMDDGLYYTVTSASGGYALPLVHRSDSSNADGTVSVHLAGLPGGATRDATLTIPTMVYTNGSLHGTYRANLKWDVQTSQPPGADRMFASISGGGSVVKGDKLRLIVSRPAAQTDLSAPLVIAYQTKGSAVAGVDYQPLPGSVTIPVGKSKAKLVVQALDVSVLNRPPGGWTLQIRLRGVPGKQGKASVTFTP